MEKITVQKEAIVLDKTEKEKLIHCLDYCYQGLMTHGLTGLHHLGVNEQFVDYMRKALKENN